MGISWGNVIVGLATGYVSYASFRDAFGRSESALKLLEAGEACPGDGSIPCRIYPAGTIESRAKRIAGLIHKGSIDPRVRRLAVRSVSKTCGGSFCTPSRDALGELQVIFRDITNPSSELAQELQAMDGVLASVKKRVRYTGDARLSDQFQSAARTLFDFHGGDCFPSGTLLLRDDYSLIPVEELRDGMKIWGRDRWSDVQRAWYKGILAVDAIRLNNGSTVKLTPDHHVFVAHCTKHTNRVDSPCSCPVNERELLRITVAELEPGMVLITPEQLPLGHTTMDPDRAYIEGLYISDGWSSCNSSFQIAGQDGCPKEDQKREVQTICERLNIPTTWQRKYISVKDPEWTLRMHGMGQRALNKHALSINLDECAAAALLRGIMADSGANHCGTRTFTTTSPLLCTQVRVLHKMFGMTCGYSYIENHGGLGDNPIWRLSTRDRHDGKAEKLLRVKEIERNVIAVPCYDLTTDDHYVYLPEHDVTVSQCDDFTITLGSLYMALGYAEKLRIYTLNGQKEPGHIALRVSPDKHGARYVTVDGSVDSVVVKGKKIPVFVGWDAATHSDMIKSFEDYPV